MDLTRVQTIGIETGISFTGVTTVTSLNATQGANISLSGVGVAVTIVQSGTGGYVQVGTSSTVAVIDNSGRLLMGIASTTSDSRAVFQASSGSATGGTNIFLQRGSTPASGEKLGLFAFADSNGKVGAEISAYADATWSLGDYPGRIVFSTTPDGSSTVTERLRIDDGGNLILDSDLDTYIHHPAADTLAVTTGGSERLRIDSSGRLLMGTSSAVLDTSNALLQLAASAGSNMVLYRDDSSVSAEDSLGLIRFYSNAGSSKQEHGRITCIAGGASGANDKPGALLFYTTADGEYSPSERLRIDSSGRVGIGTNSPGTNLHIGSGSGEGLGVLLSRGVTTNFFEAHDGTKTFIGGTDNTNAFIKVGSLSNHPVAIVQGNTSAIYIDTSRRVGIGTTAPGQLLEINGASNPCLLIKDTTNNVIAYTFADDSVANFGSASAHPVVFRINNNEAARIDTSNRLLVGTSSDISGGTNYVIQGVSSTGGFVALGRNDTTVAANDFIGGIQFLGNDDSGYEGVAFIGAQADGTHAAGDKPGRLVFSTTVDGASSPAERLRINDGGTTGIRPETARDVLYLCQPDAASGSLLYISARHSSPSMYGGTESFRVFTNGNVQNTNNSYGSISDIKLKENIVDANSQWDDLKALQVRNYNFKEGQTHTQIGLVAQEAELVSPGLVSESPDRDEDGNDLGTVTKSVNYSVLYMKAVKALQEAMERIETLEARLSAAGIE